MAPFPVIDSTLSPVALEKWIAEHYGFHEVVCRLIKTNANHTYLVESSEGQYVLRIYNHRLRTRSEVSEELKLLDLLRSCDVPVSYPIASLSGECVLQVPAPEGVRLVVMFSFAEGNKLRFL